MYVNNKEKIYENLEKEMKQDERLYMFCENLPIPQTWTKKSFEEEYSSTHYWPYFNDNKV